VTNELARWQFATTSIYHFLFVPVTIGLAFLVALLQTAWHRNGEPEYKRLTKFFGTLLLINVAVGVVTGLVQEFEFGMNWSAYARFVGDVFGGPLAMEGCGSSAGVGFPSACTSPASGWSRSARCSRRCSSWRRTRGCSTPSATS
jgi:cytochrome bd-type quinol oxidase subunit 1